MTLRIVALLRVNNLAAPAAGGVLMDVPAVVGARRVNLAVAPLVLLREGVLRGRVAPVGRRDRLLEPAEDVRPRDEALKAQEGVVRLRVELGFTSPRVFTVSSSCARRSVGPRSDTSECAHQSPRLSSPLSLVRRPARPRRVL